MGAMTKRLSQTLWLEFGPEGRALATTLLLALVKESVQQRGG